MFLPLLALLPALSMANSRSPGLSVDTWILVTRCRASCMEKFVESPPSDTDCINNVHCKECWLTCARIQTIEDSGLCEASSHVCPSGCESACSFTNSNQESHTRPPLQLTFTSPLNVSVVSSEHLILRWTEPRPQTRVMHSHPATPYAIFAVFWRFDAQSHWKLACMTAELWASIEGPLAKYDGLRFKLLAVVPGGVVAVASADAPSIQESSPAPPASTLPPSPLTEHLSVTVKPAALGGLYARLVWSVEAPADPISKVVWGRQSCRTQQWLPKCHLPKESYMVLVPHSTQNVELPSLTYNSEYWVELYTDIGTSQQLTFNTDLCPMPDATFTRCQVQAGFETATLPILSSHTPTNHIPVYTGLATCILLVGAMVAVITLRRGHLKAFITSMMEVLRSHTYGLRQSLRGKVYTLRDSFYDSAIGFRASFRRSLKKRGAKPKKMWKRGSKNSSIERRSECASPMLSCLQDRRPSTFNSCSYLSLKTSQTAITTLADMHPPQSPTQTGPNSQSSQYLSPVIDRGPLPPIPGTEGVSPAKLTASYMNIYDDTSLLA